MQVEIWSDVVCTWCYLGKRRFERALAEFEAADEVEVRWRSFQLDPTIPKGSRRPHAEVMAEKFGGTAAELAAMTARLVGLAAQEGLAYDFDRVTIVNTFDAHRLTHLANEHGVGTAMHERLLRAQLVEGEVLDDVDTLTRLAAEVGVPADLARQVVESDAYTAEVQLDIQEARALGATGVPFFVIDRTYGVSGAQPVELFLSALQTAREHADQRRAS